MANKISPPPHKLREWAGQLLHIEVVADAACYTSPGSFEQSQLLRQLVRETRELRAAFVRQIEKKP